MNDQSQQSGWYYVLRGENKGPISAKTLLSLYDVGLLKNGSMVLSPGSTEWQTLSQSGLIVKGGYHKTNGSTTTIIIVSIIAALLILIGIAGYKLLFSASVLQGGWKCDNAFGVTTDVLVFDKNQCWIYDQDDKPFVVDYRASKEGNNTYRISFTKKGSDKEMSLYAYVKDNDTLSVGREGSTRIFDMKRIDKNMAKHLMGIN